MSYYCVVDNKKWLAGPVEINHAGFNSIPESDKAQAGFLVAELINNEPQPGKTRTGPVITRKKNICRCHYRHSENPDPETLQKDAEKLDIVTAFNGAINDRLVYMPPVEVLVDSYDDIQALCADWHAIDYPGV